MSIHMSRFRHSAIRCSIFAAVLVFSLALFTSVQPKAHAATTDALPTVQITGIVWAQTIVGNTVYATGSFTKARPAGSAAGSNESSRPNILAYDITTGKLLSFKHTLNGEGRAITASPDGSRVYVGGKFTTVDGVAHSRIAAFNTADGSLVSSFTGGVNNTVKALTATNSTVYLGGNFSTVNGQARGHLAAFSKAGTLLNWKPSVNAGVAAMIMAPGNTKVIFGGSFSTVNGATYHAIAAADSTSGAPLPWATQSGAFPIKDDGTSSGITSLSTDGTNIYLTGFNYGDIAKPGGFEGRAAFRPTDGSIVWINDCHGDSYSAFPVNGILYSVGHAHDCEPMGYFHESNPRTWRRLLAETTTATHKDGPATNGYWGYQGWPATNQLNWYPNVNTGTYSGATQGGWSLTGNKSYISMGGEFTKVNGKTQQGLARFKTLQ